jgi:hypothetical protein
MILLPPLQGIVLPEDLTWKGLEQWLRQGGAGGEVLLVFENTEDVLVFENTEDVLCHDQCAEVGVLARLSAR